MGTQGIHHLQGICQLTLQVQRVFFSEVLLDIPTMLLNGIRKVIRIIMITQINTAITDGYVFLVWFCLFVSIKEMGAVQSPSGDCNCNKA